MEAQSWGDKHFGKYRGTCIRKIVNFPKEKKNLTAIPTQRKTKKIISSSKLPLKTQLRGSGEKRREGSPGFPAHAKKGGAEQ